ncbi:MAG TPA: VWA domain-containing protein [Pyrinomonadaceae bacterium]|nr:VWA domain-containing protein [Pyrinomonadaceae bacterium]
MKLLRQSVSVVLLFCLTISVCPQDPQDPDIIRVDTSLTNLLFTATDKQNRYITTLKEQDLRLIEDGVPQTITTFQRETDRPLAIAFLIDVSASQERTLSDEKAATRAFIETVIKSDKDEAAMIAFTHSAFLEQDLTRDVISLYRALQRIEVAMPSYLGGGPAIPGIVSGPGMLAPPPEGSTAIWEAIALTNSRVLAPRSRNPVENQRRRAIILLTDGFDTSSRLKRSEAVDSAIATEAVVYAIGIGDGKYSGVDKNALRQLAESTGGRAFFPRKQVDLTKAFSEIEQELRTQYLITYTSSNKLRDGSFRQIKLEVVDPLLQKEKLKLRYRPGYFARSLQ